MIAIAWAILQKVWPYLLAIAIAAAGYYKADHWCNAACRSETTKADAFSKQLADAKQRATDLALLYSATITKSDEDTRNALAKQAQDFSRLADASRRLPTLPSLVISAPTWLVLDNASDLANSRPPAVHQDAPAAISESALAAKWSDAAAAYADAFTHWSACVSTYEGIRNEQLH